ncbi:MAG: MBL fold metallo-hydrolase [Caldilineaceae bacterium]
MDNGITVHRINMLVSNAFLIETDAGVILVDAGLPLQENFVLRTLKRIGRADDLRLIYITHAHVDHYGSANAIRAATGAPIAVHQADAATMAAGESPWGRFATWIGCRTRRCRSSSAPSPSWSRRSRTSFWKTATVWTSTAWTAMCCTRPATRPARPR